MPKTRNSERSVGNKGQQIGSEDVEPTVANVNKRGSGSGKGKRGKIYAEHKSQKVEPKGKRKALVSGKARNKRMKQNKNESSQSQYEMSDPEASSMDEETASFCEGENYVQMEVRGDEDAIFSKVSDEEDEEDISQSQQSLQSVNNNATRAAPLMEDDMEEGQIDSDTDNEVHIKRPRGKPVSTVTESGGRKLDAAEKEEMIGETLARVKEMIDHSGISETASLIKQHFGGGQPIPTKQKETKKSGKKSIESNSEMTIYKNAVQDETGKRFSSSSEEGEQGVNVSDEILGEEVTEMMIHNFISDNRPPPEPEPENSKRPRSYVNQVIQEPRPSTSRDMAPEDRANNVVREAEQGKANIFQTPGKDQRHLDLSNNFVHSAMVDEDYYCLAGHLDASMQEKIQRGEYVDLAKLMPRDRMIGEDEQKLQMIMKNSQTF